MKERPILFNAPMVRAILAGRKTQTRRVVKPQPNELLNFRPYWWIGGYRAWRIWRELDPLRIGTELPCPYGRIGDRLWVRETFTLETQVEPDQEPPHKDGRPVKVGSDDPEECGGWTQPHYRATDPAPELQYIDHDGPHCRWRPSIFMPRWASRITLEITGVRIERLQDISVADALAEGIVRLPDDGFGLPAGVHYHAADPSISYWSLWDAINGRGSVEANPWVWVVEFERVATA